MMKRCLSLLLVVGLIAVLAVPVSADGNSDGWIELLEFTSVQANNENWFTVSGGSGSFTLPLHTEKRLLRVDMLVWHQTADYPVSAKVGNMSLQVIRIENNLSRITGRIPTAFYEKLTVNFGVSTGSAVAWELLSCKVTPILQSEYAADAIYYQRIDLTHYSVPSYQTFYGLGDDATVFNQFCLQVNDWKKYDSITIVGSIQGFGLNSIRASIGNTGLPYSLSYTEAVSNGTDSSSFLWSDVTEYIQDETSYEGSITGSVIGYDRFDGKVLFNLTIDLTGVDRSLSQALTVWFTGLFADNSSYIVQFVGVTGSVNTADTSDVTWWNRFTTFMTDLFGGDDPGVLDDLGDSSNSISSNTDQIHGFEQSQQAVLDNNFNQIQTAVTFTNFAAALVFVQKYANMTFSGISGYAIVFTLPLFLGLFFYLCSRIPAVFSSAFFFYLLYFNIPHLYGYILWFSQRVLTRA